MDLWRLFFLKKKLCLTFFGLSILIEATYHLPFRYCGLTEAVKVNRCICGGI